VLRIRMCLKPVKRHVKITSEWKTAGTVPGRYFDGVFRVAAMMRRMHRVIRRTLSCQASASRRWTQTIRGGEDRATRGCN